MSPKSTKALRLLKDRIAGQGARFGWFLGAAATVSAVDLLPPRVFRLFAEQVPTLASLSEVSAATALRSFLIFGMIVALMTLVTKVAWDLAQEWMYLRIEAALRREVLRKIHAVPFETLDDGQRGDWLTRVSADLRSAEQFIAVGLPGQVRSLLLLAGIAVTFVWHGGMLAAALLASAALLVAVNVVVQARLKPILEELRSVHGGILQALLESYEGLPTIRSLGAEAFVTAAFEVKVQTIVSRGLRLVRRTSLVGGGNGFATSSLAAVCLTIVAWRVTDGALTVADAMLYPFYLGMFYSSALAVVGMLNAWNRYLVEGGRLADFLYGEAEASLLMPAGVSPGAAVQLRGVEVGFRGAAPLTPPFDLQLVRGRVVVIRGPSGCGKSTFMEMLAGLRTLPRGQVDLGARPDTAPRTWDGPVRLPLTWSAYVEQHPFIFEGTLRANLAPTLTAVDDQRLWDALRVVNLATYVERSGGLDTPLLDTGKNFSAGQRYRLALARALLLDRPFLLLDEPFASLDPFSVAAVCTALASQRAAGRGVIVVSHQVPPDLKADEVLEFPGPSPENRRHRIPGDAILRSPS